VIAIIDNYDSFVYNLAQYVGELGWQPAVFRNDKISVDEIEEMHPSHILISPGPCSPREAGISNELISRLGGRYPILGVCLGHQCIGQVYGAEIAHAPLPTHGKSSLIYHDGKTVYKGLPNPFEGGRYHSLAVRWKERPKYLVESSHNAEGVIMGIRHTRYAVEGIQFHPESIMTSVGHDILRNFLSRTEPLWPGA
jgi:anthranilate synthase/aminodeoxychorismate synthase-like glutamine amidotransferase